MRHVVTSAAMFIGAVLIVLTLSSALQTAATRDFKPYTPPQVSSLAYR